MARNAADRWQRCSGMSGWGDAVADIQSMDLSRRASVIMASLSRFHLRAVPVSLDCVLHQPMAYDLFTSGKRPHPDRAGVAPYDFGQGSPCSTCRGGILAAGVSWVRWSSVRPRTTSGRKRV